MVTRLLLKYNDALTCKNKTVIKQRPFLLWFKRFLIYFLQQKITISAGYFPKSTEVLVKWHNMKVDNGKLNFMILIWAVLL